MWLCLLEDADLSVIQYLTAVFRLSLVLNSWPNASVGVLVGALVGDNVV